MDNRILQNAPALDMTKRLTPADQLARAANKVMNAD